MSSLPPTCQTPSLPRASRAASSSSVACHGKAGAAFGCVGLRLRLRLRRWHLDLRWRGLGFGVADGRRGRDGVFAGDRWSGRGRLDALERRLADHAVARPAAELGADDELRADPGHADEVAAPAAAIVLRRGGIERRIVDAERRERLEQHPAIRRREARPDLAAEPELAVLVDADDERAEVAGVARPGRPAADDELLLGPDLDLEPGVRAPARLVARALELGDDALELLRFGGGPEGLALTLDVGREADARMRPEHALEQALAVLERDVEQQPAIEVEQVERLVDEVRGALVAGPLLEQAEVGATGVVEGDDLAVDDRLLGVDPGRRSQEPREVRLGVLEVAGPRPDLAVVDDRLDAVAVPLDLEQPVRVAERPWSPGSRASARSTAASARSTAPVRSISAAAAGAWPIHRASRSALTSSLVRPVLTLCG